MNVLIIQPQAREFDLHLAAGLKGAGIEPVFIYTAAKPRPEQVSATGAETLFLPLRGRLDIGGIWGLRKLIGAYAPRALYCGTAVQCFAAIMAQLSGRRARLVFYRGALRSPNWLSPSDLLIFKSGRVDVFHCASRAVAELLSQAGLTKSQIVVFPPVGYPAARFDSVEPSPEFINRAAQFRIGAVANYRRVKGLEFLIDAFGVVLARGLDAELYIVGKDEHGELKRCVERSMAKGRIVLTGPIRPPWAVLKTFDCLVVPSLSEGLPKVIIEAFGCGVPVVATRVGGIPEVVTHNVTGLLVEPANSAELAVAIQTLLSDVAVARRLAGAARKEFLERFEASVVAQKYVEIFRRSG
ncbi:MAG: glycosyltransferase family 4 protein [Verrucomicrobiales bacterium]|nr:glycosyltransferase family 4 protein [Verrucomicrobiales bacterium]